MLISLPQSKHLLLQQQVLGGSLGFNYLIVKLYWHKIGERGSTRILKAHQPSNIPPQKCISPLCFGPGGQYPEVLAWGWCWHPRAWGGCRRAKGPETQGLQSHALLSLLLSCKGAEPEASLWPCSISGSCVFTPPSHLEKSFYSSRESLKVTSLVAPNPYMRNMRFPSPGPHHSIPWHRFNPLCGNWQEDCQCPAV